MNKILSYINIAFLSFALLAVPVRQAQAIPPVIAAVAAAPAALKGIAAVAFSLKSGLVVMGFMGTVGFTSFVLEEAEQTCMFGQFGLSKRKAYARMHIRHISQCFKLHDVASKFNNTVGYLYPFGFAYRNYQISNELNLCGNLYSAVKKLDKTLKDAGELGERCMVAYATKKIKKKMGNDKDFNDCETSSRLGTTLDCGRK